MKAWRRAFQLASGAARLCQDVIEMMAAAPPRDASFEAAGRRIAAWMYAPASRPAPATLLFPTALGLTPHERALAIRLCREGIACLAVDCGRRTVRTIQPAGEPRRALECIAECAFERLGTAPEVDARRTAVIGMSLGGQCALHLATAGAGHSLRAAAIYYGVYPHQAARAASLRAPLMILQGGRDRASFLEGAQAAQRAAQERGRFCELVLYPDAVHQFDLFQARSPASLDAWERTQGFLRRNLVSTQEAPSEKEPFPA